MKTDVRRVQVVMMCAALLPGVAYGARLRIVAPSETQVDPRIAADGSGLDVTVHVRNDRRLPVRGAVQLRATAGASVQQLESNTDREGDAAFHVSLGMGVAASVQLRIAFAGTQETASTERVVEVTSQYLALDLPDVPPVVDIDQESLAVVVAVRVADGSAADREVQLLAGDRPLGRATTDASGRAVITVPVQELGAPGVRELVASYQSQGVELSRSAPRRLVVRARTVLSAEKSSGSENAAALLGALSTRLGPVPRAPVQVLWGNRVVGAALTDEGGTYAVMLDPEVLAQPGAEVTAVFAPSEPWFLPSRSAPLRVTPPPPRSVDWRLASIPACIAALALIAAQVRRRPRRDERAEPSTPSEGPTLARVGVAPRSLCRVRLEVRDASTHAVIDGARAEWTNPSLGARHAVESVEIPGGGPITLRVSAPGYASRSFAPTVARGGEYVLHVTLRTWREELFERLRPWMRARATGGARVLPTPREALARRASAGAEPLVLHVEEGAYGPDAPDEASVQRAESLSAAAEAPVEQTER